MITPAPKKDAPPKVKLLSDITDGGQPRKAGDVFETDEATASWLISNGYAEKVLKPTAEK